MRDRLHALRFATALVWVASMFCVTALVPPAAVAQNGDPEMAGYYEQYRFLSAPPAAFGDGLYGTSNPGLASMIGSESAFVWSSDGTDVASIQDWGIYSNLGGLSTSFVRTRRGALDVNAYHVGLSGGSRSGSFGIGYQWFTRDATALGRYNRIVTGTVIRPVRYLSIGGIGNFSVENDEWEAVAEIGVRPLGTSRLTLFADAAVGDEQAVGDAPWSVGGSAELVDGVQIVGRYFEDESVSLGLRFDLGRAGVESTSGVDADGDYAGQVSRVRLGSYQPSAVADAVDRDARRLDLSLSGALPYRQTRIATIFGSGSTRYYDALRTLRQARESDRVRTIVVNLTDIQLGTERAWELRRELQVASDRGKTVTVFFETAEMTDYYIASVADVVVMDPQGTLTLPGYALSRTYLDGTLDRLGLEFDEWRFFEYKSAAETLSRTGFSEADSTQLAEYLADVYDTVTRGIANSRSIPRDSLDRIVDERGILTARDAQEAGLVDSLARWHDRSDFLKEIMDDPGRTIGRGELNDIAAATRTWSEPDKIAVVYGIGPTSMNNGIEARTLHESIRTLKTRRDIAAVVFRVDSPGGDGLASDLVAEALKEVAKEKPVIVTQGQVAASGGYWISTYADTILAGPTTVTGSIGVIGGWLYADGWSEKTGQTYDVVQEGRSADLFTGYQLPFIGGPQIPARPLRENERDRVETLFKDFYGQFVRIVAEGRDTTEAHIREIGEGRIYSGIDGQAVGLVDELGGLLDAIDMARREAGLSADRVEIEEINPESGFIDWSGILPFPLSTLARLRGDDAESSTDLEAFIRTVLENQPHPVVMLPPGTYPHER